MSLCECNRKVQSQAAVAVWNALQDRTIWRHFLPVIGVPVQTKALGGVDSLYSIVQMPPGIPVATVAINGALNAGLLAGKILAISDEALSARVEGYAKELETMVVDKAEKLETIGYQSYLHKE